RQWPLEKWIELGRRQPITKRIALFGGKGDRDLGRLLAIRLQAEGLTVVDLVGRTRLGELAGCIGRCCAVVSHDSCGLHLAVAAGVPAVGLMGGYHFGRFYPWGDPAIHRVANIELACYYCNDDCVTRDWRCVSRIETDRVLAELDLALTGTDKADD
ncbi:MAG: glycosyltransferase family 9 protein, partial [Verrucomicrobia bacterium]|nr:glycosyltransferase family 9 protein [Verrucomicrobiota bacterium]